MMVGQQKQVVLSCGCRVALWPGETVEAVEQFHCSLHARNKPLEDGDDGDDGVEES